MINASLSPVVHPVRYRMMGQSYAVLIGAPDEGCHASARDHAPPLHEKRPPEIPGFSSFRLDTSNDLTQAALTSIFFAGFCASAFLGSFTVSTPFLKLASILSASTLSGNSKLRWNEPKLRSCR